MTVGSFIELYSTLIGWTFYNNLWAVLSGTGIVFLPFIGMVVRNFTRSATSQDGGDGTATSVRLMEIDIALALSVVVLAAQPIQPLLPSTLAYHPPCTETVATVGASGTTYDTTLGAAGVTVGGEGAVNVPLWWYGVMAFAGGANHALIGGFSCVEDLRAVSQAARSVSFENLDARREYDRFASECYLPALSKYNREQPDTPATQALLEQYGADDPAWIGSHIFQDTAGYYDFFRAVSPVPDHPFVAERDTEYDPDFRPNAGRPTCKEWWEGSAGGPEGGLRRKLIDEAGIFDQAKLAIDAALGGGLWSDYENEQLEDTIIKDLQANGPPSFTGTSYGGSLAPAAAAGGATVAGGIGAAIAGAPVLVGAGLGAGAAAVSLAADLAGYYTMMYLVREAAPIVQALILMAIYAFLPLITVFSGYNLSVMVLGAVGILTVKLWSVLWMLAWWLDQHLLAVMYPDPAIFLGPGSLGLERILLDMVVTGMYVGLPLILSVVIGWGGIQIGAQIARLAESSASRPASMGGKAAGSAVSAGGGKLLTRRSK